ncbi:MAG: RnfABCDGE type electron transport complex subunit G [Lentimicrobiaceae bacterium]|nr:RnfABCDGE type electron transport complex subunit G [Lentimicrobiaceae bacterium]
MKKKESTLKNMLLSLAIVAGIAGVCLGFVYGLTKDRIDQAAQAKKENALKSVLPAFEKSETLQMDAPDDTRKIEVFKAFNGEELVGVAVSTYTKKGFGGEIDLMVGILPDGTLNKVSVLSMSETPGLGTKMTDPGFYTQFEGKHPDTFKMLVKKDGGDVDAITSATISSRAYCDALSRAYKVFNQVVSNN